jgi:predicted PhzF superfamily epimerase YddE/YHI9
MELRLYQVDAFTREVFGGNPAAVVPLEDWLDERRMQAIAAENNLSETAFFVRTGARARIRWFTPVTEVDLCGHATLAAAWVLFERLDPGAREVVFDSASGPLPVRREGPRVVLDFPSRPGVPAPADAALVRGLGAAPREARRARDTLAVFEHEAEVRALRPDFAALAAVDSLGVIATAPGADADFVSRFFAPRAGVPEDPVTGSSHCTLVPYWAERLGRSKLHARQVSARGGELWCALEGDRVSIAGEAALYLEGVIRV